VCSYGYQADKSLVTSEMVMIGGLPIMGKEDFFDFTSRFYYTSSGAIALTDPGWSGEKHLTFLLGVITDKLHLDTLNTLQICN
jgi:hypothetical protein